MASSWDIFLSDRLEVQRGLDLESLRQAMARGEIRDDDLARPVGSSQPWARVGDLPELMAVLEAVEASAEPEPPVAEVPGAEVPVEPTEEPTPSGLEALIPPSASIEASPGAVLPEVNIEFAPPDFEDEVEEPAEGEPIVPFDAISTKTVYLEPPARPKSETVSLATPAAFLPPVSAGASDGASQLYEPDAEDDAADQFTLSPDAAPVSEEIDLTAMVDVAFQLVLFFLVTATTIYFKTLDIPTPNPEKNESVAQEMRTLDELLEDFILVEIDPAGQIQVDREPVDASELDDRLRDARSKTLRTSMLLMADFGTPHKNTVTALDAANAVGLSIAMARPMAPAN